MEVKLEMNEAEARALLSSRIGDLRELCLTIAPHPENPRYFVDDSEKRFEQFRDGAHQVIQAWNCLRKVKPHED